MRYSHRLSDAVHILAYVEIYRDGDLSSQAIAASVESNPALVRRLMGALRQAGLLATQRGSAQPHLLRDPATMSLLDIYRAVEPDGDLLHVDDRTNPQCIVGGNIQETLRGAYQQVQRAAENQMAQITLAELISEIQVRERKRANL
ncbi:transcriptional regulator [Levilactobacillus namurensis]|uniref:Rrf2 family transcriptional regulator n=1 Tax=Levilactobacillus namurensis TaxID=380393 RepID=UPI0007055F23|nr:Rrf2 family transcriptional regulator [Levilactobacillus namurensis]PTM21311.1 Rrf2 family transcriptional regulator [Lactobacillus sp. PFC-70]MCW3779579.1 Rrf2 family transcriptional regulator [Levilactobacillus namurensis]MDT7017756.1 Rrf2 family transcriptional regulator [Levilactobacillus namurensis]WNN65242.1 Rrf2 family transcriptional regulator [Levilactobacillus namurensis]GEO74496.1 transcriptional regulator [Levilactobacillus namurensis]